MFSEFYDGHNLASNYDRYIILSPFRPCPPLSHCIDISISESATYDSFSAGVITVKDRDSSVCVRVLEGRPPTVTNLTVIWPTR